MHIWINQSLSAIISAISFMIKLYAIRKFKFNSTWGETTGEDGSNFKIRVALVDSADTVVTQDFTIYFNDTWQSVTLPLQGFEVYRGRQPRYENIITHFSFIRTFFLELF